MPAAIPQARDDDMLPHWSRVQIAGHDADVFEPPVAFSSAGASTSRPAYAVLFLHGVGQETLAESEVFSRLLEEYRLPCVSPHGKYTWWSDRISREFDAALTAEQHLLTNVVPWIESRWGVQPPRIGLLGISMGGQGALRLAFKYPERFPVVAAIAPAIEYHAFYGRGLSLDEMYDSKEQCRQDSATLHVRPDSYPASIFFCVDPADADWHRGADRLHEKLRALGIVHNCDLATRRGGHSWEYFDAMARPALQSLREGLLSASRRLL